MKKERGHYNLRRRLFAVISVLVLTSVLLVSLISTLQFGQIILEQSTKQTQQLIEQISMNTSSYISELSRLCMAPYYSERIMKLLESSPASPSERLDKSREIEGFLKEVMTIPRSDIIRVGIFSGDIYMSSRTGHPASYSDAYQNEEWYKNALSSSSAVFLPAKTESRNGYSITVFSMVLRLQSLSDSSKPLGAIRVDANYSGIRGILDNVDLPEKSALYIVDSSGSMIYTSRNVPSSVNAGEIIQSALSDDKSISVGREAYILNTVPIEGTDWTVIAAISKSVLMQSVYSAQKMSIIIAIISILLGLIVSAVFAGSFIRPIHETVGVMQLAQQGNLAVRAPESKASEIDYLNRSFNEMLQRISDMMDRNTRLSRDMYEAKYLHKIAQYNALYNQIKPHFLFNTLSTISLLIKSGRDDDAVKCINELSVLLRGMVNTDKEISLEAELKIVESYLSLQSRRHDSLQYSILTDGDTGQHKIPALTVQPIVENAVIHGCEPSLKDIRINVSAYSDEQFIFISVVDNGVGMDHSQLSLVKAAISDTVSDPDTSGSRSVGLSNIAHRLQLRYGKGFDMVIESSQNVGTKVLIRIPKLLSERGVD